MKRALITGTVFLSILLISQPALAYRPQWDLQGAYQYVSPQGDMWDKAQGGEFTPVYWYSRYMGLAFCGGYSKWDVADRTDVQASVPGSYERFQTWSGDVQYIPVGLTALSRQEIELFKTDMELTLAAGFRYMIASSNVQVTETERIWQNLGPLSETQTDYDVDYDNGWITRVGANLLWPVNRQVSILLGAGYQFDLNKGDATVKDLGISESVDLEASYFQVGLTIEW